MFKILNKDKNAGFIVFTRGFKFLLEDFQVLVALRNILAPFSGEIERFVLRLQVTSELTRIYGIFCCFMILTVL